MANKTNRRFTETLSGACVKTPEGPWASLHVIAREKGFCVTTLYYRFSKGVTDYAELTRPVQQAYARNNTSRADKKRKALEEAAQSMREVAARKSALAAAKNISENA